MRIAYVLKFFFGLFNFNVFYMIFKNCILKALHYII